MTESSELQEQTIARLAKKVKNYRQHNKNLNKALYVCQQELSLERKWNRELREEKMNGYRKLYDLKAKLINRGYSNVLMEINREDLEEGRKQMMINSEIRETAKQ